MMDAYDKRLLIESRSDNSICTGLFVAGTDTNVGKTVVSVALIMLLRSLGRYVVGLKPIAAGVDQYGCNEDVSRLMRVSSYDLPYSVVCPYLYHLAIAPHIAAKIENKPIELNVIRDAFIEASCRADIVVVEGVGGFLVPLTDKEGADSIPIICGLKVILVIALRLGCLNHALLSVESILSRGLTLAGFVINSSAEEPMDAELENIEALQSRIPAPCLGVIPYLSNFLDAWRYLDKPNIYKRLLT